MKTLRLMPILIPLLFCGGCQIQRFNKPPGWASSIIYHTRWTGLNATYQGVGVAFGWGSSVWEVIPVSTNKVYAAPISDTFRIGESFSPFSTVITEDVVTGWEGNPPPPRFQKIFHSSEEPKQVP